MPSIAELRSALGTFAEDKNDEQLLQLAATSMGVSPGRIASEYGYKPTSSGIAGLRTGAAIDQYKAGLYGLGEAVTGADFFRRGREAGEFESNVALERARAQGAIGSFGEVQGLADLPSYIGGLAIGSAPYALEALGGGLAARGLMAGTRAALGTATAAGDVAAARQAAGTLRAGQTAGGVAAAYPSAVGGILQAQREQAGETDLGTAAALGVPFAALNALGIEGALARQQLARSGISALDNLQGFRGGLARAGATGARTGLVESGTETLQEMTTQIGRMAVDPSEAFLSDAALERYKESAIGGAFLGGTFGGATGFGRSEGYRAPMAESDLTQPLDTTTRPDSSQFVTQDQTVGLKKFIDVNTGVVRPSRKDYEKQFEAAFNEPSGQFVSDAATGVERELTVGELMQRGSTSMDLTQDKPADTAAAATAATKVATTRDPRDVFLRDELKVIPNNNSRQLFTLMEEQGIDPTSPDMVPVWNYAAAKYMTPSRLVKATELMDTAIIQSRKEAPSVTPIPAVQQPAGGVGVGGPVVQGGLGDAGRVAPVAGTVVGGAPAAGAPLRETSVLPSTAGQPVAPVAQPLAPGQFRRAPRPMTVLEAARATPTPPMAAAVAEPAAPDIIGQIFGEQDADIIRGFMMGKSSAELAAEAKAKGIKGRGEQMIRNKIAGEMAVRNEWPKKIADAKQKFGYTDQQIQQALEASMAPDADTRSEVEREMNLGRADLYGARMSESEAIEAGLEGSVKSAGAGSSAVKGFTKLQKDIDAMYKRLETEKDPLVLAYVTNRLTELQNKVEAFEDKEQARIRATAGVGDADGEADLVAAAQKAESQPISDANAAEEAQAAKLRAERAAKLKADRNGLAVGDTVKNPKLGTGVVKSFAGDGDATTVTVEFQSGQTKELSVKLAKLEKTDAIQIESPAGVSVQPEAEAGKGVGRQVRRAKKPAAEGKAQAPAKILTEAEQAAQAWDVVAADFPEAPKFAELTKAQQQNFIGFGEGNWERGDVELELTKLARTAAPKAPSTELQTQYKEERFEREMRAAASTKQTAPDDVKTTALRFVPFETALDIARRAVAEGVPVNWVQFHSRLDLANEGAVRLAEAIKAEQDTTQRTLTNEPVTIDVESRIIDETVAPQVAKLPAPQVTRLENHYGVKRDTAEFMAKVKADVVLYATKGAEAVAGAIRDVIKAIHTGVLAAAMIFNPTGVSQLEAFVVIPQEIQTTTQQVLAELPAEVTGMSDAGKQAYATLIPALKGKIGDKFVTIADKPSGRIFVFKANGDLVLQKKALFGLAKGDLYKGNNDLPQNRVTPAGLFGINVVDAAKGGAAATTAGEYDFGKVFALDDPDATVTFMHSVWLKESDAAKRAAALKNESAADSRYSFGCINVDKETFKEMVTKYSANMDGSKLFVVPDVQSTVNDFITGNVAADRLVREGVQPVTTTTATPVKSVTKAAGIERIVAGKEERAPVQTPAQVQAAIVRKSRRSVRTADQSGVEFESVEASLDDLSNYSEGIAAGIRSLRNTNMGNAVDAIDSWMVTFSPVSWDAIYTMIDGKRTIIYNGLILKDKVLSTTATLHEVGHGIDEVQGGAGKFSGNTEFRMSRVNGELMSMRPGSVADELLSQWEDNSETSALGGMLNYPLDMTDPENRSLTMQELREEVFAQVWAFSNMNGGMDYLRDNLPTTHAFMEKAHEQVKATNYAIAKGAQQGAQSGQVQAGQQNAQPAGTIFRASRQAKQGLIDRNIAKLPKMSQQPVKNLTAALGDLGGKYLDYALFTNDLVKRAQALGLGAAKTFADRLAARNAKVSEEERKIEKIADGYASIEDANKGEGPGSVNEFLFESTRTGKWGYGKYRDAAMGAAFDKLGPKAQQFVKDVFAHGDATLSNKKRIVLNAANSEYDAMITAAQVAGDTKTEASLKAEKVATLKRFQTLFRIREGIPYAPIKRTGQYVVIGESAAYKAAKANKDTATIKKLESDPDHYHVSFVDTKWQARNLSDKLAEQGVFDSPQIVKRSESFDEAFSGEAMLPALTKMRAAVDRRAQDATGKKDPTAGKLLNIINQLYLEALAEGSARKSEMRRRGVAGEVDMLQSFTQQGRADANFLASVEFEPKIQDALQQMRNQSRTGDRERKSEIFDELTKRYADSLEPKDNPFINGLTNMASKFFLASSPGYYIQNLTQPFMMSLPAMAGRHDYTKAARALFDAYTELGPLFKDVKLFDEQFDFSKVPADVRAAINDLVNQGKIDIGLATEINEYKVEADGNLSKFAQRLNKGMRMAVQKVEATNRLSTAIAAYRLEFAKTKDAAKATQYAGDILTETHGDYTAFNAPRVFNTQWGKVALQFRKFQLIQIAFYTKLIRDAFTKPDERAAALKTLGYSLGHTAVFAGMMGLPGYAAISAILSAFGDEDEPYDLTAEMRKALGPEWADMIMRGAPTLAGMDLSGKIGAGNMLSIMPFSDADLSTNAGRAEAFGTLMGGAALGMASRVVDGLGLILAGDYYKGIERTMPKGVSDALKAGRQAAEGMTRRNGDVVLPENEIGAIDTALTALGVPAVKQAVTYERQTRMREITKNFTERTTRIKNDYAKAVREKDTAAMAEARTAWTKLQQTRQRNGLTPQPVSNLLKAPQEQRAREQRTVGGVAYREGQQKLAESVAEN